jgi:hypothetical protein
MLDGVETLDELIPVKVLETDQIGWGWDEAQVDCGRRWHRRFLEPVGCVGSKDVGRDVVVILLNYCWGCWRDDGCGGC